MAQTGRRCRRAVARRALVRRHFRSVIVSWPGWASPRPCCALHHGLPPAPARVALGTVTTLWRSAKWRPCLTLHLWARLSDQLSNKVALDAPPAILAGLGVLPSTVPPEVHGRRCRFCIRSTSSWAWRRHHRRRGNWASSRAAGPRHRPPRRCGLPALLAAGWPRCWWHVRRAGSRRGSRRSRFTGPRPREQAGSCVSTMELLFAILFSSLPRAAPPLAHPGGEEHSERVVGEQSCRRLPVPSTSSRPIDGCAP